MESLFSYKTDENFIFNFSFNIIGEKEIKIIIKEINQDNTITNPEYISLYNIDYLNERLEKIIHFNSINHFRDCLLNNLTQKALIVKPPYKSAIATIWKIFPKEQNKKNTFTLLSSSNYDKGLSLIFFGDNQNSKNIIKEVEQIILQKNPVQNFNKQYTEYIYDDKLIKNMILLSIEKKEDKEIINDFSELIKSNKNNSGKILIFFENEKLPDLIKKILDKFYN